MNTSATPTATRSSKAKSLNDLTVKNAKAGSNTIRIYDNTGDPALKGFHLEILPSGLKTFKVAYTHPITKQRKFYSLGKYVEKIYTLKNARDDARKTRNLLDSKVDPKDHDKKLAQEEQEKLNAENKIGTLEKLFEYYIKDMEMSGKRSAKTVKDLYLYDIQEYGKMKASDVTLETVANIISKIVLRGATTKAKRVESYINAAFEFGKSIKTNIRWNTTPDLPEFKLEKFWLSQISRGKPYI